MPGADDRSSAAAAQALAVRDGAARLVERAYEEAAIQGLCGEGALEYALDRLRHASAEELLAPADHPENQ